MFSNLFKMVQVKHLKLLRIRLWGCIIGLLVPPNGAQETQLLSMVQPVQNPKIDVDMFFRRIRKELSRLIKQELKTRTSAKIQTTTWIRFVRDDEEGQERVELASNSLMTSAYRGSEQDQVVDGMIDNIR